MSELATQPSPSITTKDVIEFRELNMTNLDLLPQVATGDAAAVSQCLKRYGSLVWSLARRSIRDQQAAEDAVQEIFLKLWEVAGRFDASIASETTFVAMIARRKLIDISRRKKLPTAAVEEFDGFESQNVCVSDQAELQEEAAKAVGLLNQLSSEQQKVIRLSVYDGLSHSKIADATGLSLGTVKTHIRRGFIKLRQLLFSDSDYYQGEEFEMLGKEGN